MPLTKIKKKRLGDLLLESKVITKEQLEQALAKQKDTNLRLGQTLIALGFVTEEDILNVLEMQLGIPQVKNLNSLDPDLIKSVPESLIRRHMVIPLKKTGSRLTVAMFDPLNLMAVDDLKIATGCEVDPVLTSYREIEKVIQKLYGLSAWRQMLPDNANSNQPNDSTLLLTFEDSDADESPAVKVVNNIIIQAVNERASDIHIEPNENDIRVRFRVDGLLHQVMVLPKNLQPSLVTRLKILAKMDIAEKRLPQDGRFNIKFYNDEIDLRVSALPTVHGEKIVLRLLNKTAALLNIKQLGFDEYNLNRFLQLIKQAYGMVLITGPTGSGKTTTLYSVLSELNSTEKNIVTVEEPVEYLLNGINQTQVNVKAGLTFANGLRSILRQDPDVIMVGEIRDAETAEIAVRAASTGHLVFSTLHTNDAAGAVTRLIDMGVEPFLVASSVLGVVSQRLIRVLCPHCKQKYVLSPGAPAWQFIGRRNNEPVEIYRAVGCSACNNSGYSGRISIQEVMPASARIKIMAKEKCSSQEIKAQAIKEGMVTLKENGIGKVLQGLTTVEEVMRVCYGDE